MIPYNTCTILRPSKDFLAWDLIPEADMNKPLRDFQGVDILTTETMRQIKDNNDKVKANAK